MLGRDELVLELPHLLLGLVEDAARTRPRRAAAGCAALHGRLLRQRRLGLRAQLGDGRAGALDERARQLLVEERERQVLGVDLGVAAAARELLRGRDGLLGLDRQLVEVHRFLRSGSRFRRGRGRARGGTACGPAAPPRAARARAAPCGAAAAATSSWRRSTISTPARFRPELGREPLDQPQPLEVGLRVEARVPGRPLRPDETLGLVDPQRLRVHADELGGDRDHVARVGALVGAHENASLSRGFSRETFWSASSASRSAFVSFVGTVTRTRARRSPLPPPFSFGAPWPRTRSVLAVLRAGRDPSARCGRPASAPRPSAPSAASA